MTCNTFTAAAAAAAAATALLTPFHRFSTVARYLEGLRERHGAAVAGLEALLVVRQYDQLLSREHCDVPYLWVLRREAAAPTGQTCE